MRAVAVDSSPAARGPGMILAGAGAGFAYGRKGLHRPFNVGGAIDFDQRLTR